MIEIHTPMKCQNEHPNVFVIKFAGGDVISQSWLLPLCKCPKGEIGEGYAPSGDDYVITDGEILVPFKGNIENES